MAWKANELMTQWQAFLEAAQCPERDMAALCREYGISRPTGYKWWARGLEYAASRLQKQSRRPPNNTPLTLNVTAGQTATAPSFGVNAIVLPVHMPIVIK